MATHNHGSSVSIDSSGVRMQRFTPQRIAASLRHLVVLLLASSIVYAVPLPRGLTIDRSTEKVFTFSYEPVIDRWDTVMVDGREMLRPRIADAGIRQSTDGRTVQWVVSFDLTVPGQGAWTVDRETAMVATVTSRPLALAPDRDPSGRILRTSAIVPEHFTVTYTGIARNRHIATVEFVVAQSDGGTTKLYTQHHHTIGFTQPAGTARNVTTNAIGDVADFTLNHGDVPWRVSVAVNNVMAKGGDGIQASERLDNAFRITIDREGIYRITADELRKNNIPVDAATARTIKIFGRGGLELDERVAAATQSELIEQDIIIRTKAGGEIDDILFYASGPAGFVNRSGAIRHYIHHYATTSGYLLTYGGSDGHRAQVRPAATGTPARITTVTGRLFQEDELVNAYSSGSGRRWYGRTIENGGAITITTLLPGLVRSGAVDYQFSVAHRGSVSGLATMSENGTPIAQRVIPPVAEYMDTRNAQVSGTFDASKIPADGRSVLKFAYASDDKASTGLVDYFEIHYPRALQAADNEFEFWSDSLDAGIYEWVVNGFSGDVLGFDVTDRTRPKQIENIAATGGMFGIRETIGDTNERRRYYMSGAFRTTSLQRIEYPNLRTVPRSGELIVITHPSLLQSARDYATYRQAQGEHRVAVVTTEEIFNEFSYGIQDPTAIRDFLGTAFSRWTPAPRYVLLWGDGHYDYKNLSTSAVNYIPPYESDEADGLSDGLITYTSDDFFVCLLGEDARPEMAIGRMPVTSEEIGRRLLGKIDRYEHSSSEDDWRTRITLIADDGPTSDGQTDRALHLSQSEDLNYGFVPQEFQARKIYMVEYPTENVARGRRKPAVEQDMLSVINTTGNLILNWIGHGNPRVWAHENIFVRETTVPQMTNTNKLFFLTAATCDFARFDMTENQSGAEELVLLDKGGAIGVFSAARVVLAISNAEITQKFYSEMFRREGDGRFPHLGDIMYRVKQARSNPNDQKFFLLGDPVMRLLVPDRKVTFSTINGQDITDSSRILLPALSKVHVTGHIQALGAAATDTSFNGAVTVSLVDAESKVTVQDNDKYQTINIFKRPGAALSRTSAKVENGIFTAEFVVPKDISFSAQAATLYGYGVDADRTYAMGATNKLTVDGVADITYNDTDGPDMKIFMDSRYFNSGEIVRPNPILIVDLQDATGINTTGIGIGHNLEAVFDKGLLIENLTNTFSTSLENSRAGTASKQIFGLGPGLHTVHVRSWDVLNNTSEVMTLFRIADAGEGVVTGGMQNYPNPFADATRIRFKHNISQPFTASVRIFGLEGRLVFERPMELADMQTAEVTWDGRDDSGFQLGSGIYVCVVRVTAADGTVSDVSGKLTLIR